MKHKDGSFRLKNWDYSNIGLYFLTICTKKKGYFFGNIENDIMVINEVGLMVESIWRNIETHYSNIEIVDFVIMPNHFHGILIIVGLKEKQRLTVEKSIQNLVGSQDFTITSSETKYHF